jgi:hypothetical protein
MISNNRTDQEEAKKSGNRFELVYSLPEEILKTYANYQTLEDYNNTCSYENIIEVVNEEELKAKILRENCTPNAKTLSKILDAGWTNLCNYLVNQVYLPNLIDPTHIIYTYTQKYETQVNRFKYLIDDLSTYEKLPIDYKFENLDSNVKIGIKLPDPSFVIEYLSVYCYKDSLKINSIFRSRQRLVRIVDSKTLFDVVESECENNYNPYNNQLEINLVKINKIKKWHSLFK